MGLFSKSRSVATDEFPNVHERIYCGPNQRSAFVLQQHRVLVNNFRIKQDQTVTVLVLSVEDVKPIWQYALSDT